MHPLSDLAAIIRKTTGDVPPKLIGASATVIASKLYLFGGRPVSESTPVAEMYICNLETFMWEKLRYRSHDTAPPARYFHSADAWNYQLFIFGGIGNNPISKKPDDLRALSDVHIFDTLSGRWLPPNVSNNGSADLVVPPKPRHSHLSAISSNRLVIIGGQDLRNVWLDDIYVYDLRNRAWIRQFCYPRHYGSYLSVAAAADQCVRLPLETTPKATGGIHALSGFAPGSVQSTTTLSNTASLTSKVAAFSPAHDTPGDLKSDVLSHLPFSAPPSSDFPSEIHVYSNYNFSDVKAKLEVFSPVAADDLTIRDESSLLGNNSLPPCLRFPVGVIVGTHLVIAGAHISTKNQCYAIWALNLLTMTWSKVDAGQGLPFRSWFQACLWRDANRFLMFGNRREDGGIEKDHIRRLSAWDHVVIIDLEAFGIYQPPPMELDIKMQGLSLTALEECVGCDYEVICDDGRRVKCSRRLLEERWPWFKSQLSCLLERAKIAMGIPPSSSAPPLSADGFQASNKKQPDPRISSRSFKLSEQYAVTLALVQYFYTLSLLTPLQQAPAVLSRLLVLSSMYRIHRLQSLVKHAMHLALSDSTCAGVYEVATLCGCQSLRIRAYRAIKAHDQSETAIQVQVAAETFQNIASSSEESSTSSQEHINDAGAMRLLQPARLADDGTKPTEDEQPSSAKNKSSSAKLPKKSSKLFGKVLRATSLTPSDPKPSPKWRTGGGRHPVVTDHAARARKIQAIEAAMNDEACQLESQHDGGGALSMTRRSAEQIRDARPDNHRNRDPHLDNSAGSLMNGNPQSPRHAVNQSQYARKPNNANHGLSVITDSLQPGFATRNHSQPAPSVDGGKAFHRMHILSASTENEIRSITEMLSPIILHKADSSFSNRENDWAIGDDGDSMIEPSLAHGFDTPSQRVGKFSIR